MKKGNKEQKMKKENKEKNKKNLKGNNNQRILLNSLKNISKKTN